MKWRRQLLALKFCQKRTSQILWQVSVTRKKYSRSHRILLRSESIFSRNKLRFELTQRTMMEEKDRDHSYWLAGKSRMEQIWQAVQFGGLCGILIWQWQMKQIQAKSPTILEVKSGNSE